MKYPYPFLLGAALLLAACGGSSSDERPLSTLLVTLDTTIPDVLHCYGGLAGATPHLDALAAEGILFENARTVTPMTLPSHASMMTGLYPVRHSVRMNGSMVLPGEASTLAERARERGYRTGAFIAAVVLNKEFGLDQGFEVYDEPQAPDSPTSRISARRRGETVADHAIRWLEGLGEDEPFFSWVHFFDPHAPYEPPPEYLERPTNPQRNPYLGEVTYMDDQMGRLCDTLKSLGRWDDTIIVVVADHGEGLGRKGEGTHATFAFDTTLAVPLLVRHPDRRRAGERSRDIVSVVDVYPTLIRALGFGAPGDVDGFDLLGPGVPPDRGVYFETYFGFISFGWSQLTGWADARGKYIFSSAPEFYDMVADPTEERNVIASHGAEVARYRAQIERLASRPRLTQHGMDENAYGGIAAQIEKLGYVGAGTQSETMPEPLARVDGFSPHERIQANVDFLAAQRMCEEGRSSEAIPILQRLWSENPKNHNASFILGVALLEVGRPAEAVAPLRSTVKYRGGEWIGGWLNLGIAYERIGDAPAAIDAYEHAFKYVVGPPGAMERLVKLLRETGDEEKAQEYEARLAGVGRSSG